MQKRYFLGGVVAFLTLPLCAGIMLFAKDDGFQKVNVRASNHTLTLNSSAFAISGLTTDWQKSVVQDFGGDNPVMNYFMAKKDASNNLVLAPSGKVYNYKSSASYKGRITNIESITVNYSGGTLFAQEGVGGEAAVYGEKLQITTGVPLSLTSHPNHVMITNSYANTTITSITVDYVCTEEAGFIVERLGKEYNGMAADHNEYTLTRNGNNVSVAGQSGTIALDSSGNFTMSLASGTLVYTGSVSADYKTLYFTGKTGSNAALGPTISEMNRIYIMEDFEKYSRTGTGYTTNTAEKRATATDLRAAYYGDYGGGGSTTWVTSSNFNYAVSSDYLNLATNIAHSGTKSATFKGWTGGWTRAWSIETFDNLHYNFGSGNRFSFWAHGAYTNTGCTTAYSGTSGVSIRVQVYYDYFNISDSNRNSTDYGTGTKSFDIPSNSDWTRYSITLDPTKTVRAVNIMVNNKYQDTTTYTSNVFIPIDDLTIDTVPVYEPQKKYNETSTKITKSYHGIVTVSYFGSHDLDLKVGIGANGYVEAYCGVDMVATSYSISGNQITITTTGSYSGKTFGTWIGTLSNNNSTITITNSKSTISGTIQGIVSGNSIVLSECLVAANGTESNSVLQYIFYKQNQSNEDWVNDSSSDSIVQNTSHYIEGSNSIKTKATNVNTRLIINPTEAAKLSSGIETVSFWFYVPATYGKNFTISIFAYTAATPTKETGSQKWSQTYDYQTEAGWHYVSMGLGSGAKNFAIFIGTTNVPAILDYVTYF